MSLFPEFHDRYGPWAVVAGASEGIGRAYTHILAERGLNVITVARRTEPLEQDAQLLRRRHRVEIRPVSLDLADPELEQRFAEMIAGLDVGLLIYNACYSIIGEFCKVSLEDYQKTIDVNCRGPVTLAHQLTPRLIERGKGGILLMTSMAGFQGSALVGTYAATKAFDTILGESLWTELAPYGVDAMACVAGATETPDFLRKTPAEKKAKAFPMQPEAVAREGIQALENCRNKGPIHIVGRMNRTVNAATKIMSHKGRTKFFSKATRDIYENAVESE
ncbi:MAG: SDR family NAD(P)-dependent oxidoreductase [Nevskiales bacterium]